MQTTEQLAALIGHPARPPVVSVPNALPNGKPASAALLAWGRHDCGQWFAGVCLLINTFHGSPIHGLVTIWLPAHRIARRRGDDSTGVPRIALTGDAEQWPQLPPLYPGTDEDWRSLHRHATDPGPDGLYGMLQPRRERR